MTRTLVHYGFFVLVSAAIHWFVIGPPWPAQRGPAGEDAVASGAAAARSAVEAAPAHGSQSLAGTSLAASPAALVAEGSRIATLERRLAEVESALAESTRRSEALLARADEDRRRAERERDELVRRLAETRAAESAHIEEAIIATPPFEIEEPGSAPARTLTAAAAPEPSEPPKGPATPKGADATASLASRSAAPPVVPPATPSVPPATASGSATPATPAPESPAAAAREAARVEAESIRRLARAAADPASVTPRKPTPGEAAEARLRVEAEERALGERLALLGDGPHADAGSLEDAALPPVRFAGPGSEADYLELQRFYGMKVIAFPPSRAYLATIDLATGEVEKVPDAAAFLSRFPTRRGISERGATGKVVAARVAARLGGDPAAIRVLTVFPRQAARYLAWKELEVCRKAGIAPSDVQTAVCSYERRSDGAWVVRVVELVLGDGRRVPVEEVEGRTG